MLFLSIIKFQLERSCFASIVTGSENEIFFKRGTKDRAGIE